LKSEEDRKPIYADFTSSIKYISKVLTEHRRIFYLAKREKNKYQGRLLKPNESAHLQLHVRNCKNPFCDALLLFTIKAQINV
jgi:hypothetical protein